MARVVRPVRLALFSVGALLLWLGGAGCGGGMTRAAGSAPPTPGLPAAPRPPVPTPPVPTPDAAYREGAAVIVKAFRPSTPTPSAPTPVPPVAPVPSEWAPALAEARALGGLLVLAATAGPYLNVRAGPGTDHAVTGRLAAGAPAVAFAWRPAATAQCTRGWFFLRSLPSQPTATVPAAGGWACATFLHDVVQAAAGLPGDPP